MGTVAEIAGSETFPSAVNVPLTRTPAVRTLIAIK